MSLAIQDLLALLAIPGPPAKEGRVAEHLRKLLFDLGVAPACLVSDEAHRQSEYGGDLKAFPTLAGTERLEDVLVAP